MYRAFVYQLVGIYIDQESDAGGSKCLSVHDHDIYKYDPNAAPNATSN